MMNVISDLKKEESLLRTKGLKVTPARLALLEVFLKNDRTPLSASHVGDKLKEYDGATIYRNLSSLERVGVLKRVYMRNNADTAFYELTSSHHHHIVCQSCGKMEDFELCHSDEVVKEAVLHSKNFKQITDHSVELLGICIACEK